MDELLALAGESQQTLRETTQIGRETGADTTDSGFQYLQFPCPHSYHLPNSTWEVR